MDFLGARYYLRGKTTKVRTFSCRWYSPNVRKSPITGYKLFRTEARARHLNADPERSILSCSIYKRVRREWKRLPEERKEYYRRKELSEVPAVRRCTGIVSFRDVAKRTMDVSDLVGYSDHSYWFVSKDYLVGLSRWLILLADLVGLFHWF